MFRPCLRSVAICCVGFGLACTTPAPSSGPTDARRHSSDIDAGDDDGRGDGDAAGDDAGEDAGDQYPVCSVDHANAVSAGCRPTVSSCVESVCESWRCENLGGGWYGSTIAEACNGTVYVSDDYSEFVMAISSNGTPAWVFDYCVDACYAGAEGAPVVTDNGLILVAVAPNDSVVQPPSWCEYPLIALNPDGTEAWRFSYEGGAPSGPPVLDPDGNIYVVIAGRLFSLSPDGGLRWIEAPPIANRLFNGHLAASTGGSIFVAGDSSVFAYGTDGIVLWTRDVGVEGWSVLALALTDDDQVIWSGGTPSDYVTSPTGGIVQAVDSNGAALWTTRVSDDWAWGDLLVSADGIVIFRGSVVGALSARGEVLWTMSGDNVDSGMQLTTEGLLLLIGGQATVLDLATGGVLRTLALPSGAEGPALLSSQVLLATNNASGIIGMQVPLTPAPSGWPVTGGNARRQGHRAGQCAR